MIRRLRARLIDESGLGTALVVIVISITMITAGSLLTESVNLSGNSNKDDHAKSAFQAAEAGLDTAVHGMNTLEAPMPPGQCFANGTSAVPNASGWCGPTEGDSDALGKGQTFKYWTSTSPPPGGCAGTTGAYSDAERCIVAVGTDGGVPRRTEMRVGTRTGSLGGSEAKGLLGLDGVTLEGAPSLPQAATAKRSQVGSNGPIVLGDKTEVDGNGNPLTALLLGKDAPDPVFGAGTKLAGQPATATPPVTQRLPYNFTLPPPDFVDTPTVNANSSVVGSSGGSPVGVYSDTPQAPRHFNVPANTAVTLGSLNGQVYNYNFCQITLGAGAVVNIPHGAKVRIFLDSPARTGSGCVQGQGSISAPASYPPEGAAKFESKDSDPFALWIIAWGNGPNPPEGTPEHEILVPNPAAGTTASPQTHRWGVVVYAPYSHLRFQHYGDIRGAIAAKRITIHSSPPASGYPGSSHFHFVDDDTVELDILTKAVWYRTVWRECPPTFSGSDPNQGC